MRERPGERDDRRANERRRWLEREMLEQQKRRAAEVQAIIEYVASRWKVRHPGDP